MKYSYVWRNAIHLLTCSEFIDQNLWEKIQTMSYLGIWKSYQLEILATKSIGHMTKHRLREVMMSYVDLINPLQPGVVFLYLLMFSGSIENQHLAVMG